MNDWKTLLTAAILGTERSPSLSLSGAETFASLYNQIDDADHEEALLSAAGFVGLYYRAGEILPSSSDIQRFVAAPLDNLPPVGMQAMYRLTTILSEQSQYLLEWLSLVQQAGKRIPDMMLPQLLNEGVKRRELQGKIASVIGSRGMWLASLNPHWSYVVTLNHYDDVWRYGSSQERAVALRSMRANSPEHAREMLSNDWARESPEDRAAFLAALRIGLNISDEPFLEMALDDRRKEVRTTAISLLSEIPESRFIQRMIDRANQCLIFRSNELNVMLPAEVNKEMERDGIEKKLPTYQKIGERDWWFRQIISSVPPSHWEQQWQRPIDDLLKLVAINEWSNSIIWGLCKAVEKFPSINIVKGLLQMVVNGEKIEIQSKINIAQSLLRLSYQEYEPIITNLITKYSNNAISMFLQETRLLQNRDWSISLTSKLMKFGVTKIQNEAHSQLLWQILSSGSHQADPQTALQILPTWHPEIMAIPQMEYMINNFTAVMETRYRMRQEIHSSV